MQFITGNDDNIYRERAYYEASDNKMKTHLEELMMSKREKQVSCSRPVKDEMVIFRATKPVVESLDKIAKLIGVNRSEALRRLIPDLHPQE